MQGAGKTSLLRAVVDLEKPVRAASLETFPMDVDVREGIAGGLLYSDSTGVNLQVFPCNSNLAYSLLASTVHSP